MTQLKTVIFAFIICLLYVDAHSAYFITEAKVNSMTEIELNAYSNAAENGDYQAQKVLLEYYIRNKTDKKNIFKSLDLLINNISFSTDPDAGYHLEEANIWIHDLAISDNDEGLIKQGVDLITKDSLSNKYPKSSLYLAKYYLSKGDLRLAEMHLIIAHGAIIYLTDNKLNDKQTDVKLLHNEIKSLLKSKYGWETNNNTYSYFKVIRKNGNMSYYNRMSSVVLNNT